MPARIIGLYSLACMEREGPVYGYFISDRISERTGGAWRPGAGAVYPALQALVERGLASRTGRGRRLEYRITLAGRRALRRLRLESESGGRSAPDLSALWADVVGRRDLGPFLLHRLHRTLVGIESQLARTAGTVAGRSLRGQVVRELAGARTRIATAGRSGRAKAGGAR